MVARVVGSSRAVDFAVVLRRDIQVPQEFKMPPARVARVAERLRHYLYRLHQRSAPPPLAVLEMILGAWVAQAIQAAAELGIADALAERPLPLDELARRVDADPDALKRLMRALISRGMFRERRGRYELTALAEPLRSDAQYSMVGWARFVGSPQHREHWSDLVASVRTGAPAIPRLRGKEPFEYLAGEPEFAAVFNDAMTCLSRLSVLAVVAGYSFDSYSTIVDVGGGHGILLAGILESTPTARGVLYDLPDVVEGAPALLAQRRIADRVRIEGGSFFDSVPSGGDAYVLKNVIHDWADEPAIEILRNVREAAAPTSKLLLVEAVLPDHDRDFVGNWVDLEMLVQAGGHERDIGQWRKLLQQAGFRLTQVVPTAVPLSVIEATPA